MAKLRVKVLNNFNLFDGQKLLSPPGEPLAVHCSDECFFMSLEDCVLEVCDLRTLEKVARFRTVGPARHFTYCKKGDCLVTLERKASERASFARVYFKWRGSTVDQPIRVSLMHTVDSYSQSPEPRPPSPPPPSSAASDPPGAGAPGAGTQPQAHRLAAEIVEIPTEQCYCVTCLACCQASGTIAVGMQSVVRVLAVQEEEECVQVLYDVKVGAEVLRLDIFENYIACLSEREVRVLKVNLASGCEDAMQSYQAEADAKSTSKEQEERKGVSPDNIEKDETYIKWSPRSVYDTVFSCPEQQPLVGSLSLPSITSSLESSSGGASLSGSAEVLGPLETSAVRPQVEVEVTCCVDGEPARHSVFVMLYRRLAMDRWGGLEGVAGTQSLPPSTAAAYAASSKEKLHSVQLLPETITDSKGEEKLVGLSCLVADCHHGYLYDVHQRTRLVLSFSFISPSMAVSCDSGFLHTISKDTLECYTFRLLPSSLSSLPSSPSPPSPSLINVDIGSDEGGGGGGGGGGGLEVWLGQPYPSPAMDLLLVSSNKFPGACRLAASQDQVVLITKSEEAQAASASPRLSSSSWLLESLHIRRLPAAKPLAPPEASWNVYVLKKKSYPDMFHQLVSFAESLNSPPVQQHLICEGHLLLRSKLLTMGLAHPQRPEATQLLKKNCFVLAKSLCALLEGRGVPQSLPTPQASALYFILSGCSIADVFTSLFNRGASSSQVLRLYLNCVLFDEGNKSTQDTALEAHGKQILEKYAEWSVGDLSRLVLYSWFRHFSKEKALEFLTLRPPEHNEVVHLSQAYLYSELDKPVEAGACLNRIPKERLTVWMEQHPEFMTSKDKKITPFGKVVAVHCGKVFLSFLSSCSRFSFGEVCSILQGSGAESVLLKQYLEQVVMEGKSKHVKNAVLLLVDVLLDQMAQDKPSTSPSPSPSSSHTSSHTSSSPLPPHHPHHLTDHPSSGGLWRYRWLNVLPASAQQNTQKEYLELQCLLCSDHMSREVGLRVEGWLSGRGGGGGGGGGDGGGERQGDLALKLLTWPHTGKLDEAVELVLNKCPDMLLEYCLVFLGTSLERWKGLLDLFLERLRIGSPLTQSFSSLYKSILEHVVTITTPEEFMGLLPANGSLEFFLPLIEQSCRLLLARDLETDLSTPAHRTLSH